MYACFTYKFRRQSLFNGYLYNFIQQSKNEVLNSGTEAVTWQLNNSWSNSPILPELSIHRPATSRQLINIYENVNSMFQYWQEEGLKQVLLKMFTIETVCALSLLFQKHLSMCKDMRRGETKFKFIIWVSLVVSGFLAVLQVTFSYFISKTKLVWPKKM